MGGSFSSSSSSSKVKAANAASITTTDRAILDLKNARDRLQKYRTQLEADEKKLTERAKAAKSSGDTRKAMYYLKIKRHKTKEADNANAQLLTVMQMVDTISSKQNENELLSALKTGKDALAALHSEMSIDDVIQLMDEVEDQNEMEKEINDILAQGAGLDDVDVVALEAELLELVPGEAAAETEKVPDMPVAPSEKLPEVKVPEKEKKPARVAVTS
mmetsp:Transcript_25600/g.56006  ORF Transcript_25600/g.56006 Transcript_25600/m.56006 type:complete len:217 (+) Transcript_25600:316-966(+)|eukprot:CAMPEP_0178498658 /NCGR_PEP_ID=MMETSP0696-20121128/15379_1 /TAXON_ID=265572 /ORGANISM="Extubocellulus spinifer, Strain CCMP396" /LENGTH=216 /DNA_ID=CAMNT_0020127245 /DNA_START=285 /DNA_END=935 /DNA_ORIENTATION=-